MGIGLDLLSSIIQESSRATVAEISEQLFVGEQELSAYRFFINHYRSYGQLPTADTFLTNGIRLPRVSEPLDYYMQRCRNRVRYNALVSLQGSLPAMIRDQRIDQALDSLRETISTVNMINLSSAVVSSAQAFDRIMLQYDEDQSREGLRGVTLGYDIIDRVTDGAQGGDIIIIAGRPNQGKSYLLLKMAIEAWTAGSSILFASMEMTVDQVARRMVGMMSGISPDYIRRGEVSSFNEGVLHNTIEAADSLPPFHFVSGDLRKSVGQIDTLIQQYAPDVIYIDAGYLLHSDKGRAKDRREKISDVAEELKATALVRNRPIVTTVQLNRQGTPKRGQNGRSESEPGTENLAETDVLGQIATAVMLLYPPSKTVRDKRIVSMSKNRDGPLIKFLINFGFTPLNFNFVREIDDDFNPETDSMDSDDLNDSWGSE